MRRHLLPALMFLLLMTLLTGLAYPMLVTGLAAVVAPEKAGGSLVRGDGGRILGSSLVGQSWDDPRWFWGRPSATSPSHNAAASSGSNAGPTNPALAEAVAARVAALRAADPEQRAPIPVDLVTTSASGLDPHVSPEGARWQVGRVARARGLDAARVRALVEAHVEGRTFGLLGEPRVNVLQLNLALESLR
jgi:potassium-transporting ATPase KdpC subunit